MLEEQEAKKTVQVDVLKHLGFAKRLAVKFHQERPHIGVELDDFISAAMLGLCDAAQRYDAEREGNFQTFSYFRIKGAMYEYLRRSGGISRAHYDDLLHPDRPEEPGEDRRDRLPFNIARDVNELERLSSIIEQWGVRLHIGVDRDSTEVSYLDDVSPEVMSQQQSLRALFLSVLTKLPPLERQLLDLRYYKGQSFEEMREAFGGVSKSWLSRVHVRALIKLRIALEKQFRASKTPFRTEEILPC